MAEQERYVVVTEAGRAINMENKNYWKILLAIHDEYCSAGGNWDRPSMLIRNGKLVIHNGLASLAWKYGEDRRQAINNSVDIVQAMNKPDWLNDGK